MMTRYFFDFDDGTPLRDETGRTCSDLRSAAREAYRCAADRIADPAVLGGGAMIVTVRDGPDSVALTLRLAANLETSVGVMLNLL